MSLLVSVPTHSSTAKLTAPTIRPVTRTKTRVAFFLSRKMAAVPPMAVIISTLSTWEVIRPVPLTVRNVRISVTPRLTTYAGRVPSRLTASIAASTTGMAFTPT